MQRKFYILLMILFLIVFVQGCIGPKPKTKTTTYFTLEYNSPGFEDRTALPVTLQIQRFQVAPDYNTEKIVFREKDFKRNQYNYERWRSNPRDMVTYFLNRDMRESGLFQGIFPPESLLRSSHLISGTVDEFYEKDGDPWHAVLTISITLLKANEPDITKRVMFQKSYHTEKPCTDKTPDAFIQAMGDAMAELSVNIIDDLYHCLSESLPDTPNADSR